MFATVEKGGASNNQYQVRLSFIGEIVGFNASCFVSLPRDNPNWTRINLCTFLLSFLGDLRSRIPSPLNHFRVKLKISAIFKDNDLLIQENVLSCK